MNAKELEQIDSHEFRRMVDAEAKKQQKPLMQDWKCSKCNLKNLKTQSECPLMGCRGKRPAQRSVLKVESAIINTCDIVCCTLGMAASGPLVRADLSQGSRFNALIIDEASQATEVASLIPLRLLPPVTILVGDPKQLPPFVKNEEAKDMGFGRSLFDRLTDPAGANMKKHVLSIQYVRASAKEGLGRQAMKAVARSRLP
jgi:hypothetical protein